MNAEAIAERLAPAETLESRAEAKWLVAPELDARSMAQLMLDNGSRFVTLTVVPDDDGFRFIYHWDVEDALLNVTTRLASNVATSIADIWPAADWVEREARDYYGIQFENRAETPPLMLQDDDEPGLFTRTCTVTGDPANTDWSDGLVADGS
jgi:NADH:ubiquinone oxidoreductase subunit C